MDTLTYPVGANDTDPRWRPLLVTATMSDPVAGWRDDAMLDGPLSWGAYLAYIEKHGDDLPPRNPGWAVDFDLPVARWAEDAAGPADERLLTADGQVWGWCVSEVLPTDVALSGVWVRRKPALEEMSRWSDAKRHHVGLGPLKARNVLHPAGFAPQLQWMALGDPDGVLGLLRRVTNLGRMSRHGNGRVLSWAVDVVDDWDGWRLRSFPHPAGDLLPVRAPAHHASRRHPCA